MALLNKHGVSEVDAFLQHYLRQHPEVIEDQRIAYQRHWYPQGSEDPAVRPWQGQSGKVFHPPTKPSRTALA